MHVVQKGVFISGEVIEVVIGRIFRFGEIDAVFIYLLLFRYKPL